MEPEILSANDLLKSLCEDYGDFTYNGKGFACSNEKELLKAKFGLLLNIVFLEYQKVIDDSDITSSAKGREILKPLSFHSLLYIIDRICTS